MLPTAGRHGQCETAALVGPVSGDHSRAVGLCLHCRPKVVTTRRIIQDTPAISCPGSGGDRPPHYAVAERQRVAPVSGHPGLRMLNPIETPAAKVVEIPMRVVP